MSHSKVRRLRHVAVLIESSRGYGRGLIEGVAKYSLEQGTWSIYFETRGVETSPEWVAHWHGDGVLARFTTRSLAAVVLAKGVPVVDLYGSVADSQLPLVSGDNARISQLAFDHFWERGIRHFGYCGLTSGLNRYMDERGEAFRLLVAAAGCSCSMFAVPQVIGGAVSDWKQEEERKATWLATMSKPVGVLACVDELGCQVLNACRRVELRVPEEVAVIGVGNDSVVCDMSNPTLSSIDYDAPRIGYQAAACLDRLMRGGKAPRRPIRLEPRGLVARRSTDMLAVGDPTVAAALQLIREHACDGMRVEEVVKQLAVSCSLLERKFREALGHAPKAELLRIQIARARQLLAESDLPLKVVAQKCGFNSEKYFSDAFCRQAKIRPAAYRKLHRWSPLR